MLEHSGGPHESTLVLHCAQDHALHSEANHNHVDVNNHNGGADNDHKHDGTQAAGNTH